MKFYLYISLCQVTPNK